MTQQTSENKTPRLCNRCGLSCALPPDEELVSPDNYGLIDATVYGGYFSTPGNGDGALDDMSRYTFSLCEWCLDWLFQQFKVPVAVYDNIDYQPYPYRPAKQRVEEDEWRADKAGFYAEFERRNQARNA